MADVAVKNFERVDSEGFQQVNSSLGFSNISWADAGGYQCVAQNGFGVTYSSKANVTVHSKYKSTPNMRMTLRQGKHSVLYFAVFPHFVKRPANITVRLGSNAKLECGAKGYPLPEIAFQKGGGVDFPAAIERRFHVMPNDDSFMILDTQLADMGTYCCSAKNSAGEVKACASVTVYGKAQNLPSIPPLLGIHYHSLPACHSRNPKVQYELKRRACGGRRKHRS